MSKSSAAISLVLLTTAASAGFIGYKAITTASAGPDPAFFADSDNDGGSDFGDEPAGTPTTNPSTPPSGGHPNSYQPYYYDYHTNHYYYSRGYSGSNSFSTSHGDPPPSSGAHVTGTSRGGFGSTGHAMSHAGS